jgi:hypothetical protein
MLHDLEYYAASAREAVKNDNERDDTYQKIDDASRSIFENPPELKALPWIQERKFVSTAPADALNAAIRTFAARTPDIEIQPLSENPQEYQRVESLEEAMKWEFKRMNSVGSKSPHWRIVEYAMKYCAVAVETCYLPWYYLGREKEPRIQEILRSRHFRWDVHDPSNIHVRESDDTLECVVNTSVKSIQQLIDMFGRDHPGMDEVMKTVDPKNAQALYTTYFTLYDYTDWDSRVKWVAPNSGSNFINRNVPTGIELMRKERTISFLPWVYVNNKEPLLKQMVDAGLWENVNILRTMQFSKAVDMAAHPEYWIQTPDGTLRGVSIDNTNPNQPLVTGPGTNVQKLPPPSLDPQLSQLTSQAESEVFRTTVAQILASVEKYAGTQNFSVVNAMLNAAIAQLSLAQMVAERAETSAMIQNFRWIKETEMPMVAFRENARGEYKPKGQEIVIRPKNFDDAFLYLKVTLNPSAMSDKQTEINNAINKVERLGMSMRMAWDELGLENFELSESQKTEESLYQAHVQAKAKEIMMKPELEAQAAQQQAEQAQANPGPGGPQSQFSGQQGMPGPASMPGQGREQLNGQAANGESIS